MSRRSRARDSYELREAEQWARFRFVCTGRGAHAQRLIHEAMVLRETLNGLTFEQVAAMSDGEADAVLPSEMLRADPVAHRRDDGTIGRFSHMTWTFRCPQCGRTVPLRDGKMQRRALALMLTGVSYVDISSLDRVALS